MKQIVVVSTIPRLLSLVLVSLFLPIHAHAEETALIDIEGQYAAYIAEKGIVYLWEGGSPPAYIEDESIYSFDGNHLGWLLNGYIVDHNGYAAGAIEGIVKGGGPIKPFKGFKGFVPFKSFRRRAPRKPQLTNEWSTIPLEAFLRTGLASERGEPLPGRPSLEILSLLQKAIKLKEILSDSEYRKCGLHKLTGAQLANLEKQIATVLYAFVGTMQGQTLLPIRGGKIPSPQSTTNVIESYIDGTFEGWDGETIFKLVNGQIWQQAAYSYTYHYAYRPEVLIMKTAGGYKMKVEDVEETIYVRRLK